MFSIKLAQKAFSRVRAAPKSTSLKYLANFSKNYLKPLRKVLHTIYPNITQNC